MSEHYFSKKPQSKSAPKTWNSELRGSSFSFTSDVGVFSKQGIDFGTRLLIEHFKEPEIAGKLLDLGCGYGPIGIAIAHSYPERHVVMVDVNERAVSLAKENAQQNGVKNVALVHSDSFTDLDDQFAAVITNPPIRAGKKVVYKMFEESYSALLEGGELWIVIQRKQGAPSAEKKLQQLFGDVQIVTRKKGYFIYKALKLDPTGVM